MARENKESYPLGRLILEYLRVFMWPLIVLLVVLIYQADVRKILSEREVDIFGVRIGKQVVEIEKRATAEIADIRHLLEAQRSRGETDASGISEDIDAKLTSLERNLNREISQIRQVPVEPAPPEPEALAQPAESRASRASSAEHRGFEALLERDVEAAIDAFAEAREIWPDYHNVAEVLRMLEKQRVGLQPGAEKAWHKLYRTILTRYSWGLADDLRPRLREAVDKAY